MYQKIKLLVLSLVVLGLSAGTALATIIDLTVAIGDSGTATAAIGGVFEAVAIPEAPTGTGVFDPFVRIQATGNEQGYNTDLSPAPLDDKAGIWTHALDLATVPTFSGASNPSTLGVDVREFILDINEPGGPEAALLSLNQIQIFIGPDPASAVSPSPSASSTTDPLITFAGATEVFRLNDANAPDATRNVIELNYRLQAGSGQGDMALYIPASLFVGYPVHSNVIFYSQFGDPRGQASSADGFEEWAVSKSSGGGGGGEVPEPATLLLLGSGLVALAAGFRRKLH